MSERNSPPPARSAIRLDVRTECPKFPPVYEISGRKYVRRVELEQYKLELIRSAIGGSKLIDPPRADYDAFVPLKIVAAELGVGRRTIGRRISAVSTEEAV
jgi:hypothetical protein